MVVPGGKRIYILVAALGLVAAGLVAYVTLTDKSVLGVGGPPPALSESTAEVSLTLDVTLPDRISNREQSFRAEGVVDYLGDRAQMHYDFSGLLNAGGFLGHLQRFDVFFADDGMYVEVFRDGPPWILFESTELVGLRIERLRETALSSPLLLPLLLEDSEEPRTGSVARYPVEVGNLRATGEAEAKLLDLLDELGIKLILVSAKLEEGYPSTVRQELRFPVTEGSSEDVTVVIEMTMSPGASADITLPERDRYRTMAEFQSGES